MLDAALMVIILGSALIALAIDVGFLAAWLRSFHTRRRMR
jgi:hypothetical protein